ncbi:MAG: FTR1 family protein [Candidatus Symbiobacter sp.]|nr:FTR1 family protein [Candidatus Symbiobacter sp.]
MLATLIIVFRELIEAGLVIGIVLTATRGVAHRGRWVGYGILGGILGACIVAVFADSIAGMMDGAGQESFNALVLAVAVVMLTWHNVWMARDGRHIAQEMKLLGEDVSQGRRSLMALAVVIGISVLREGAEIVLFLYGIALSSGNSAVAMIFGGIFGLTLGVATSALMYFGLLRLPTRHLFAVTSGLIALLAAGMASQAVLFLQQGGIVTIFSQTIWDISGILPEDSLVGKTLHTLIGYTDRPSGMQVAVYVATLGMIFSLMKLFGHPSSPSQPNRKSGTPVVTILP